MNTSDLQNYKSWGEFFPNAKVELNKIPYHKSWKTIMEKLFNHQKCKRLEEALSLELTNDIDVVIYPPPELLFNAFLLTKVKKVSVVIIGQDPYFNEDQAMGLSFSVPHDTDIPSSLVNIFNNLKKYNHIDKKPTHGNLENWASQGCLMLNSSLTVKQGTENKNCHQNLWKFFTDGIIKYISENKTNVIFVLWGSNAFEKMELIDLDNHEITASSHPSGLSASKKMKNEPAFNNCDHFGNINKYFEKNNLKIIDWNL
jgi:uracil-DNA glycosylase